MEIGYIKKRSITEEMKESYLDYAMSVIVARALPDVRDGLKPVHRRVLYAMYKMGLNSSAKFRKSATVVGETLGKYHPHGDMAVYDAMVRMAQDFSLRYPLINGQGNFGCFTKDTKIRLTDGRNLNFRELVREAKKGKRNWTFSFNPKTREIEIAEIKNPRLTRRKEKIMEITLDNGEKIRCTLDHLFMLRDGSYKKAKELSPDDSLMPLYLDKYKGKDLNLRDYRIVRQPLKNTWDFIHRLADKWNLENAMYDRSNGRIRHHLDFNKLNNNPDNILRIRWKEHWQLHKKIASWRHKNDPEYVRKIAEGRNKFIENNREKISIRRSNLNKILWQEPEFRKRQISRIKEMWQNPEYKEFMKEASSRNLKKMWKRKDFQELMSRTKSNELKGRWQNEEYRAAMAGHMKKISLKIWSDPEHREHISKIMEERFRSPEARRKQSRISKGLWRNPEYRAKHSIDHFSQMAKKLWENPDVRDFHRKKAIQQWQNPEFRERISKMVSERNKKRVKENPDFMKKLTEKAKVSLIRSWKNPSYKERVIKSKILGFVYSLLKKYKRVTPEIYEYERVNNGIPRIENALNYFNNFSEIVSESKKYNHRIVSTKVLKEREDVYDLTIEPHHNFSLAAGIFVHNSIDGDASAASRYTEVKITKVAEEMLFDIEKETVDWMDNYDGTRKEPMVLPSKLPQLLLNGTMGIAVGMATNIPPHNLGELVDAAIYLIDNKEATVKDLFKFVKGPDFPTGGEIYDRDTMLQTYSAGRGPIVCRAKAEIIEDKKGQFQIIVTEVTYGVNKANLIIRMADLVKAKRIEGIKDIRDESDKEGIRVVIGLKNDAQPQKVLNRLFKLTDLQKTFHLNMLALVGGIQPQILSLKGVLEEYIKHRQEVVVRRTKFELSQAKERAHILEGLKKALDQIDAVIETIKKSKDKEVAHRNLMKKFKLTDRQSAAILEMRLQTLSGLEQKKIKEELAEKKKLIKELEALLKSPKKVLELIRKELSELKKKYGDERKTRVFSKKVGQLTEEELVPKEECIIILTQGGYIKRVNPQSYRTQKRGGRGIVGIVPREEDAVNHFIPASTHDDILFFTDRGRVFQTKAYDIPEVSRTARGRAIVNLLQLGAQEKVTTALNISKSKQMKYLFMATEKGTIKKTKIEDFQHVRKNGLIALKLGKGDRLKWARLTSSQDEIILVTAKGQSIRFKETDVRPLSRTAGGVKGVSLKPGDKMVRMDVARKGEINLKLLVITERGFGKKTDLSQYKIQKRGGSGVKTAKITDKNGEIIVSQIINSEQEDLIAISQKGQVIRTKLKDIPTLGRATLGVRVMKLKPNDKVASAACI